MYRVNDRYAHIMLIVPASPPLDPLPPSPLPRFSYPLSEEDQAEERAPSIPGHEEGVSPELITMPSRFETAQEKGNIDVWWLYDDGGTCMRETCDN